MPLSEVTVTRRKLLSLGWGTCLAVFIGCQRSNPQKPTPVPVSPTPGATPGATPENDPISFIIHNSRPRDWETPVDVFTQPITPAERFFVRAHHPEPTVSIKDWTVEIAVDGGKSHKLSLEDLKKYKKTSVTAVLQCAGNSRGLYRPRVPGVQWGKGAAGNAEWSGVSLAELLAELGVDKDGPKYVQMQGADKPMMPTVPIFERQIPLTKALHPGTLLAYEMNGEPLPHLHGAPARLVVPGWVGDDWVKWITSIRVSDKELDGFYYQKAYRYPSQPVNPGETIPKGTMQPMTELVTRTVIAVPPLAQQNFKVGRPVDLRGVAWTGGDNTIEKVEFSDDGGKSWSDARLTSEKKPYAWRTWEATWKPAKAGPVELIARATDSTGFTQPLEPSQWNPGGYLWRTADHATVEVQA